MENCIIYNPTKLFFGKNVMDKLGSNCASLGKKAMLVYGQGSIKRNGIYAQVTEQLGKYDIEYFDFQGIKPNPVIEDVDRASEMAKRNNVDFIIAVGGGSVIDSAKLISIAAHYDGPAWDLVKGKVKPQANTPLAAVLTLAATGTEMNKFAVVQNNSTREKLGFGSDLIYPRYSFLDPAYTLSVPGDYTAYGIADLTAHCLEAYFGEGDASLSDKFVYAIIREAMEYGPPLLNNLQDLDLRTRIMYAATNALNNLTAYGRVSGDWGVHSIGHVLSVLYDVAHGASLSIAYPAWLKVMKQRIPGRISELGRNLFNVTNAENTISKMEKFFKSINCPVRLSELGITENERENILETMISNEVGGNHHKLDRKDYKILIDLML